jgi:predicted transcriptional regulator
MPGQSAGNRVLELTADIVSAYLKNNRTGANNIPQLIQRVHQTLTTLAPVVAPEAETTVVAVPPARPEPAVPIQTSVFDDYIICLEDGRKLRTLKRHLRTSYNMTPAQYRRRWGLGPDYPMVAPSYARQRSALARQIGLGQKRPAG